MRTITILLVFLLAGCVSAKPEPSQSQRPVLLDTVVFLETPSHVYDEAYTLAFEHGFQIAYSSPEERMLVMELPSPDAIFKVGPDWIQRVEIFVREREARGVLYLRYYSYDPDDGDVRVVEDDREVAASFLSALRRRLMPPSEP